MEFIKKKFLWASNYPVPSPNQEKDTFKKPLKVMTKVPEKFSNGHRIPPRREHLPRAHRWSPSSFQWCGPDFLEFLLLSIWRLSYAQSYAIPTARSWSRRAKESVETQLTKVPRGLSNHVPTSLIQGSKAHTSPQASAQVVQTGHSLPISILHRKIKRKGGEKPIIWI